MTFNEFDFFDFHRIFLQCCEIVSPKSYGIYLQKRKRKKFKPRNKGKRR